MLSTSSAPATNNQKRYCFKFQVLVGSDLLNIFLTFRDTDNQRNLCVQSLEDGGRGAGGRDVDDGGVRVDLGLGLQHRVEHGEAEVHLAALARGHAAHHVGAVLQRLLGVEGALLAGEALADDLGLLGQPHVGPRLGVTCPHSAQSTACLAAFG